MPTKIITDTMCDVPKLYADKHNIKVIPLTVYFGEETFKDMDMEEFYRRLETAETLPTTSQVTPIEFYNVFKEEIESGNKVIAILGSSKMSGTYNSALVAKNQLECEDIYVIDSANITMGAGMLPIKAARLAEEGLEAEAIAQEIEASKLRMKSFFMVDTLKYLHKGGRLSYSASVIGSILNIKPILTVTEGELVLLEKARGIKKAIAMVMDMIKDNGWNFDGKVIGINHTAASAHAELLEEIIKSEYNVKEIIKGEVGMLVATHAGPGAVALYFEE